MRTGYCGSRERVVDLAGRGLPLLRTNHPPMKGARIRQYRKALKLTQAKLAALVGISQGKISKIERDQQPTSMTIALRLCWALRRKTLDDFL